MEAIWYLDRAAALLAYPSLYVAVLTGIFYNSPGFGALHDASQRVHIELSVFALLVTLIHAVIGTLDSYYVLTGGVPEPAYTTKYFVAGVGVGAGALVMLLVSVAGFVDAARFDGDWGPRSVHALAYAGFAFSTLHAAAVGTDVIGLIRPVLGSTTAFLVYVLLLRLVANRRPALPQ